MVRVLAQSARGPGFKSRSGPVLFPPVTFGGSVWVRARAASSKGSCMVPSRFGDLVTGLPSGPIAQRSGYLHGLQGVLGSSPGRVMCFFLPSDIICNQHI